MLIFSQLKYKSIILLVQIFLFASFSFCHASKSLESKKQFVSDVQGVYQTTLNAGGVEYKVRAIIRNRIGDQSDFDRYIRKNFSGQYNTPQEMNNADEMEKEFINKYIEVFTQIGDQKQHLAYALPAHIGSSLELDFETGLVHLDTSYLFIDGQEFFSARISFEKEHTGRFTLKKIVLWKTGFMIPLFKKKHHIENFQKIYESCFLASPDSGLMTGTV